MNEEALEADFSERHAGRVTGKGWWTGVEPGDKGQWDMSLLIPVGLGGFKQMVVLTNSSRACYPSDEVDSSKSSTPFVLRSTVRYTLIFP